MTLDDYKKMIALFNRGGVNEPTEDKAQALEEVLEGIEIVPIQALIDLVLPVIHRPDRAYCLLVGMYAAAKFAQSPGMQNTPSKSQIEIEELKRLFKK